ncbi:sensor histidine kinase [Paenibacillus cremeus]|uniref:histidine kinase n=1 Tax=Paenibacillus cremeus TaxID=2163881 RepID=A0A559K924_9BACL|nr:sensor histidine kinase [Paenibacillus cremeus]
MQKWYHIFHKSTGLSPYIWVVFYISPFYFIFRSSSPYEVASGIIMILAFFLCYVMAFRSKGWKMYLWTSVQIAISITMTLMFGFAYFSLFLAFFIGNMQHKVGFYVLYSIHLITTVVAVNVGFVSQNAVFLSQLPFVLISLIAVVVLPVTTYNWNKRDKLEGQLEDANKRISELVKLEERQRIARDLHDTLGQKLSLIGLKSDLAGKLLSKNANHAQVLVEIKEIRQTARIALQEVRELVTQMRGTRVEEELLRVKQILMAAEIELHVEGDPQLPNTSLIAETVLSMCLKEAITNVVKHSSASACSVAIEPSRTELVVKVKDNGIGIADESVCFRGNGLRGMKERLEFVNGTMEILSNQGMLVIMRVPNAVQTTG